MPTIKTKVDAKTYRRLVKMRKAAGLPSVSALFLDKCDQLTDDGAAAEIVRIALDRAKEKSDDDQYRLRDLFSKKSWETILRRARVFAPEGCFTKKLPRRSTAFAPHGKMQLITSFIELPPANNPRYRH